MTHTHPAATTGPQPPATPSTDAAALLITRSAEFADTVTALADPAPPPLVITPDQLPGVAWARCPLILLDADTAAETTDLAGVRLDLRPPLIVSATPEPAPDVWRTGLALGAECVVCLPDGGPWLSDQLCAAATRDPLRVITVLDVCGDPHGSVLAAALGFAAAQTGRDTQLLVPRDAPTALPDLYRTLPDRLGPDDADLLLLTRYPDDPPVGPSELSNAIATARPGETVVIDATPLDNTAARTAAALADLTLLVAGPWATQLHALGAAADTLAHTTLHARGLGLVLARQRPCHTPADALATQISTAATHFGWTTPLPTHTFDATTTPDPPITTDLLGLAHTLLRDHHLTPTTTHTAPTAATPGP
jgi:hypothetical protein